MSAELTVRVHSIADDGLPDMAALVGRVAFIWDGAIVSGWPIPADIATGTGYSGRWEPSEDRFGGPVGGVTHWVEFPEPTWRIGTASQ
jgi:hypothetical protein